MQLTSNTILMTGGGSGIGRGLAEAFHRAGNQVIVAGRRRAALDAVAAANPGMRALALDVARLDTPEAVRDLGDRIAAEFPALNVLINNAGVQRPEDLRGGAVADAAYAAAHADVDAMIATNLLGPLRLTAALLPLLRRQPRSTILNVTSALAFVPLATVPTYAATKAALHAHTLSLREQLRGTTTEVVELIPPYVQTDLGPGHGADPRAMPLADFVAEVLTILRDRPDATEVVVGRAKPLRFAAEAGRFDDAFRGLNAAMTAS